MRNRSKHQRQRGIFVASVAFAAVFTVGVAATFGSPPEDSPTAGAANGPEAPAAGPRESEGDSDSGIPSTEAVGTEWASTSGAPLTDSAYADRSLEPESAVVPGTARRVAAKPVESLGDVELFTVQLGAPSLGHESDQALFCIRGPGMANSPNGLGGVCGPDVSLYEFGVAAPASCGPSGITRFAIWGIASDDTEILLAFSDGSSQLLTPQNGTVLWAWDSTLELTAVDVKNEVESDRAEFDKLQDHWLPSLPYAPCEDIEGEG